MMAIGSSRPWVVRGEHDLVGQRARHRSHLGALPRVTVATTAEDAEDPAANRRAPGRRSAPPRVRPACGRSRPAPTPGPPLRPPPSVPAPSVRHASPTATVRSSTPSAVVTAAATRALSTLNRPDMGRSIRWPRQRERDRPTASSTSPASSRRTAVNLPPPRRSSRRAPHGSSAKTTACRRNVRSEQRCLGLEVAPPWSVMVEVVPTQIGEGGHVEDDPVHPVLGKGVRRHLQASGAASVVHHRRPAGAGGPAIRGWCAPHPGCRSHRWADRRPRGSTGPTGSPWSSRWSR